ncbi:MAG TPA: MFS transporter [Ktedonobacteraceae bacterium]
MSVDTSALKQQFSGAFWKFWTGQTISAFGGSFSSFAIPLLIFQLTGSSVSLAFSVAVTVLPYVLFGLVIGAWVDRVNRRRLMLLTDLARALAIASLFLAARASALSIGWIFVVAFLNSALGIGFDAANFAAIPSLVPPEKLLAANGRILAGNSTATVLGPLIAGVLVAIVPLPALFLIDAASFLVSSVSLALIRASFQPPADQKQAPARLLTSVKEGLSYVLRHRFLSWITLLLLLINFILPTTSVQVVPLAREWFAASDTQIGLLYAAAGLGTVCSSLLAERIGKRWPTGVLVLAAVGLDGLFTLLATLTHWFWALLLFWCLRGGSDVLFSISSYSLTQSEVPGQMLGRVISFIRVLTWSTAPVGALLGGFAIERTDNIALVYATIGLLSILISLVFCATPLSRAGRPGRASQFSE